VTDQLDLVRTFYAAVNRGDATAIGALYDPNCIVEHVFWDDDATYEGHAGVAGRWTRELAERDGALPGGHRVSVSRIAGMETGWGWVLAEWTAGSRARGADHDDFAVGYSHFWIENGRILRHRSVARRVEAVPPSAARAASDRRYPSRPIVGVGAVVVDGQGRVVLVRRRNEPLAGQWSLPGGTLDLGETLEAGVAREVLEETGLVVHVGPVADVFDRILVDEAGRVHFHFVLIDYLCTPRAGTLAAGSDVTDVALADPADLDRYRLTEKARDVIMNAVALRAAQGSGL
jgi:ADP-ribose pyrophosphatase YjhB (NUDIX family)